MVIRGMGPRASLAELQRLREEEAASPLALDQLLLEALDTWAERTEEWRERLRRALIKRGTLLKVGIQGRGGRLGARDGTWPWGGG